MQIDEEDLARGLRNPFWSQAQGIVGGTCHMTYYDDNGKPRRASSRSRFGGQRGTGTLAGNGGPMQTLGYMVGLLVVQ